MSYVKLLFYERYATVTAEHMTSHTAYLLIHTTDRHVACYNTSIQTFSLLGAEWQVIAPGAFNSHEHIVETDYFKIILEQSEAGRAYAVGSSVSQIFSLEESF